MRIAIVSAVGELLDYLFAWDHPMLASIPGQVLTRIDAIDVLAERETGDATELLDLIIAFGQVKENLRSFQECELHAKQPDGSPAPRLWAAVQLLASRHRILVDQRYTHMVRAFEGRQRRHRGGSGSDAEQDDDEEAETAADRRATKARVIELYEAGEHDSAQIAATLRRAGIVIGIQRVSAIIGHLKKKALA